MIRRPGGSLLRAAVAVALLAYVFLASDPRGIGAAAAGARLAPLLLAVLLLLPDRALMAYRWHVLLRALEPGARPPLRIVMHIFFVSTFVGTFLPASVGGDAVRAYSLARHRVKGADAVASVLMDRLLGIASLLLMGVMGLVVAREMAGDPVIVSSLALCAAGCLAAALLVFSPRAADAARALAARSPWHALQRAGEDLIDAVRRYANHRVDLLNVLACSVGVQLFRVVQAYLLGRALGIDAGPGIYFAFVPLILLVMLLPVTVNGLGTSQLAFVAFFARAGVEAAPAFALSVLFLALGLVGNLPGGLLYAWKGLDHPPVSPGTDTRSLENEPQP